ncbi:biopolymer transporter ExbD [Ferruginibacter sp. SUN106]|uniref:biopolymer transporter ExbD n=1 Tax=Ferruginibacter sp. SUN106 TaxID=2978348 RepID=UPI003D36B406
MSLRKRLRESHSEVDTGPLNDILFILLMFFLLISTLANPNVIKTNLPKGKSDTKMRQSVTVGLNKDGKLYMGQMPISFAELDSVVKIEADKVKPDTLSIVIAADTASKYGDVFKIFYAAKKAGAKAGFNVTPK